MTKELLEDEVETKEKKSSSNIKWKSCDKCMDIWRVDGKHYSATIDQILEDGTCTVIFDGYSTSEITQVGQLMPRNKNSSTLSNDTLIKPNSSQVGQNKPFSKKELENKLKEARKRKKEKFSLKMKALEEQGEKGKNKWQSFNTKLASKTWKGVVKKNKFDLPEYHENKVGVGANSLQNRVITPGGTLVTGASSSKAAATAQKASQKSGGFKTSSFN